MLALSAVIAHQLIKPLPTELEHLLMATRSPVDASPTDEEFSQQLIIGPNLDRKIRIDRLVRMHPRNDSMFGHLAPPSVKDV